MRLLVIGELHSQITVAIRIAKEQGAEVSHAATIASGIELLISGKGADLVMADVQLDIASLINQLKLEHVHIPVVGYGVNAKSEHAVAAIRAGAKEYIPLPPDEKLIAAVLESIAKPTTSIVFKSPVMLRQLELAEKIAPSDASILITGESGTGKEIMARFIHTKSKRANMSFVSVNCAAIPENLLESELFGHEKGAFTGAMNRRIGKFEESSGGTLLLDEISEMDIRLQAKLLRAIQEREIDRVGGTKPVQVNLRVVATSNRNLQDEVKAGRFREDLLFRLNVIQLQLPSLRDRKEDIIAFAEHFVQKYSHANHLKLLPLSASAIARLQNHVWAGNVRELENTIHRAVLLASGKEIDEDALLLSDSISGLSQTAVQPVAHAASGTALIGRTLGDVEKELILTTLDHCLGNRTHAANILGISIRTLRNKLGQYNVGGGTE